MKDSTPGSPADSRPTVSALPYALLVPVLVVLIHDAHASMTGWSFRHNALVAQPMHPVILAGLGIIALISYFVIRPFRYRRMSRWVAFMVCVAAFSITVIALLPKLAE